MASGVHVQLEVSDVAGCPVASLSEDCTVESVQVSRRSLAGTQSVVGEVTIDHAEDAEPEIQSAEKVFDDSSTSVYRYTHENSACPCTRLPSHGCPVREIRAESERLVLSFIASDLETLRAVVTDLQACCADVTVRRLAQSGGPEERRSLLVVDRNVFTDRQYEVLETAHEMGYFSSPKGASAGAVADELGISAATFVEHLSVAQTKLLDQILSE
ncbi:helix-turn-helix domain-containing protein [Halomicroarcula limicola]|uniref:Helix-turn-helix domain-containing protein n=1 Tax=Haloarcula limicola TaxID=1429915 RepID=A0A8J7Y7M3_9EURY|nr:helix-turn-helix domain-containing protein [Halomicroarcula limicola]MBV0926075.1 helix-turn-helix domain-containing protein [Halomicroarcula limicola]